MSELRQQLERLKADLKSLERRIGELEKGLRLAEGEPAEDLGRRKSVRKKGLLRADYGTGKAFFSEIATDISEGGTRIETSRRHEVGSRLDLVFEIPHVGRPLKLKGEIVRVSELGGKGGRATQYAVGIRFLPMDGWTQRALKGFIASLPQGKPEPAFEEKDKAKWLAKIKEIDL